MSLKREYPLAPSSFFPEEVINHTYSFIQTLSKKEIEQHRNAYIREMNASNEINELPEHTMTKRRCFLYLTAR